MSLFAAVVSGGLGGFGGALLAQASVTLAHWAGLGNETLQGPWGPPFFDIALFSGVFYAAIAGSLSRRWREAAVGFAGPFLGIALPMAVLGRTARWGWGAEAASGDLAVVMSTPWYRAVVLIYSAAVWGTVIALGRRITGRWSGSAAAAASAFCAYLLLTALQSLAPDIGRWPWRASGFLPQPSALLDGLFTGALLGCAVIATRRFHEKIRRA